MKFRQGLSAGAYDPPGHPEAGDRLGMFVTAFRDGYHARWRHLEATIRPREAPSSRGARG